MSSPSKKARKVGSQKPKTRAQVEQELLATQETLSRVQSSLKACEKEREQAQAEIKELKGSIKEFEETVENFMSASAQLSEMQEEIARLRRENQDLSDQKKDSDILIRDQERRLQLLEKTNKDLQNQVKEYGARANSAERSKTDSETISAAKSTFQINLYPRQGQFQGQIVHPLSQDKKVFSGLDAGAIMEFITGHLPQTEERQQTSAAEEKEERLQPGKPLEPPVPPLEPPKAASREPEVSVAGRDDMSLLKEIKTVVADTGSPSRVIGRDQPYTIVLTLDLSDVETGKGAAVNYEVTIYAKQLGGRNRLIVGRVQNVAETVGAKSIKINGRPLPPGLYKLGAAVTFAEEGPQPTPRGSFFEAGLLQVL